MKKLLILFAAVIGFAACNEEAGEDLDFTFANEVVSTYTMEQVNGLVANFDPKKIDKDQLIADLTRGSIYCKTYTAYQWSADSEWSQAPLFATGDPSYNMEAYWLFNADGTASHYYTIGGFTSTKKLQEQHDRCHWDYDAEQAMLSFDLGNERTSQRRFYMEISYYQSPLLIIDTYEMYYLRADEAPPKFRFVVNLRAMSHDAFYDLLLKDLPPTTDYCN